MRDYKRFEKMLDKVFESPDDYPDSVSFLPLEKAQEVLTPGKLLIIKKLKEEEIDSLSELADRLERPLPSLSTDCKELRNQNLIRVEKEGNQKRPFLADDHLVVLF